MTRNIATARSMANTFNDVGNLVIEAQKDFIVIKV